MLFAASCYNFIYINDNFMPHIGNFILHKNIFII